MRRVVGWLVDALPFDARSRRAIDETLADWLHEEREQPTGISRVNVDIRSALSVARVATLALVRETGDFEWTRGLARRARVVVGIATVLGLVFTWWAFGTLLGSWWSLAAFSVMPLALLFLLPPAIVLAVSWRPLNSAPFPNVGAATFVALATLCVAGALLPVSSTVVAISMTEGLKETWKELGIDPIGGGSRPLPYLPFAQLVMGAVTCAVLATAGTLVAAAQRKRAPLASVWWLVVIPIAYVVTLRLTQFAVESILLACGVNAPADPDLSEVMMRRSAIAGTTTAALFLIGAVAYGHLAVHGPTALQNSNTQNSRQ